MTKKPCGYTGLLLVSGVLMGDILYNAAQTFQKINEYDYNFVLGNSHRQITKGCMILKKELKCFNMHILY
jgi:hypothetical protein